MGILARIIFGRGGLAGAATRGVPERVDLMLTRAQALGMPDRAGGRAHARPAIRRAEQGATNELAEEASALFGQVWGAVNVFCGERIETLGLSESAPSTSLLDLLDFIAAHTPAQP